MSLLKKMIKKYPELKQVRTDYKLQTQGKGPEWLLTIVMVLSIAIEWILSRPGEIWEKIKGGSNGKT